jgi:hypothetical protein
MLEGCAETEGDSEGDKLGVVLGTEVGVKYGGTSMFKLNLESPCQHFAGFGG